MQVGNAAAQSCLCLLQPWRICWENELLFQKTPPALGKTQSPSKPSWPQSRAPEESLCDKGEAKECSPSQSPALQCWASEILGFKHPCPALGLQHSLQPQQNRVFHVFPSTGNLERNICNSGGFFPPPRVALNCVNSQVKCSIKRSDYPNRKLNCQAIIVHWPPLPGGSLHTEPITSDPNWGRFALPSSSWEPLHTQSTLCKCSHGKSAGYTNTTKML